MEAQLQHQNEAIVARYLEQPVRLPAELRREAEHRWEGAPVQLYALADLDHAYQLAETWVLLGPTHVAIARRSGQGRGWEIDSVWRSRIEAVREAPGLSATTLTAAMALGTRTLNRRLVRLAGSSRWRGSNLAGGKLRCG